MHDNGPGVGRVDGLDLLEEFQHADGREGHPEVWPAGEVELGDQAGGSGTIAALLWSKRFTITKVGATRRAARVRISLRSRRSGDFFAASHEWSLWGTRFRSLEASPSLRSEGVNVKSVCGAAPRQRRWEHLGTFPPSDADATKPTWQSEEDESQASKKKKKKSSAASYQRSPEDG